MSLVTSAKQVLKQRRNIQKQEDRQDDKLKKELVKNIPGRLRLYLDKMPVAKGLIAEFHEADDNNNFQYLNNILNLSNDIGFFTKDLADKSGLLIQIQRKTADSLTEFGTFAIEFIDIFDLSIYFVPYMDEKKGFACVVYNSSGEKSFFIDDIPFNAAVNWVAEYLEKHPNLLSE